MADMSSVSTEDLIAYKEGRLQDMSDDGLLSMRGMQVTTGGKDVNLGHPEFSTTEAVALGAMQGIPGGADAASYLASKVYGQDSSLSQEQKQSAAKQYLEQAAKVSGAQHPVAGVVGNLGTAIPVAMAVTPAKLLQAPSMAARAIKGGLAAGGLGAAYGAGEGQGVDERASNAITNAVTYAPLGAGGSVAVDAIGSGAKFAGRYVRGLAQKAANVFNKITRPAESPVIDIMAGKTGAELIKDANLSTKPPTGLTDDVIPLTKGQVTQDPRLQSLEYGAQAGQYGDEAQRMALESREMQSAAAKNVLGKSIGGEAAPVEAAEALTGKLKAAYNAAKAKTSQAYKDVGQMAASGNPLMVAKEYVEKGIKPAIKDWAETGSAGRGWDLDRPGMENAKRLYGQTSQFFKDKKAGAIDFFRLEDWRSRVSQGIAGSKDPSEKAFLSGMLERFDRSVNVLPREAIKSGDENIIAAMEKARGARKEQGVLFERSKVVKDILTNDTLTPEQIANTLTTLGPKSGTYVRDVLRTAGKDPAAKTELQDLFKKSILGNVLNKSLSSEVKAGSSIEGGVEKMVSFDKFATEMEKLINNKTLFNNLITDAAERDLLVKATRAAQLIKSVKPGSKNYSNTAYTVLKAINAISPSASSANVMGMGLGSGLKAMGESGASNELAQALAPVLKGHADVMASPLVALGEKYGRDVMLGGVVAAKAPTTDIPTITIRPRKE